MSVWLCRAGRNGEYEPTFLEDSKIYFTYEEVANSLVSIGTKHALKEHFLSVSPSIKEKTAQAWSAQGYAFAYTMKIDEYVILPSKISPGFIHVGKITGEYTFDESAPDSYRHGRSVNWLARIPKNFFAPDLQAGFGVPLTIYKIKEEERLKQAISLYRETSTPPPENTFHLDLEGNSLDAIKEHIINHFKGHGLSHLVAAILKAKGYEVFISPPGPDRGVDILAAYGSLGFGSPKICVQVKSTEDAVGRPVLDQLIGTMHNVGAEYGLLVSWSGFRSSVLHDTNLNFFKVRYWTSVEIMDELFDCYDNLDDDIKQKLPLKRIWILDSEEIN